MLLICLLISKMLRILSRRHPNQPFIQPENLSYWIIINCKWTLISLSTSLFVPKVKAHYLMSFRQRRVTVAFKIWKTLIWIVIFLLLKLIIINHYFFFFTLSWRILNRRFFYFELCYEFPVARLETILMRITQIRT